MARKLSDSCEMQTTFLCKHEKTCVALLGFYLHLVWSAHAVSRICEYVMLPVTSSTASRTYRHVAPRDQRTFTCASQHMAAKIGAVLTILLVFFPRRAHPRQFVMAPNSALCDRALHLVYISLISGLSVYMYTTKITRDFCGCVVGDII